MAAAKRQGRKAQENGTKEGPRTRVRTCRTKRVLASPLTWWWPEGEEKQVRGVKKAVFSCAHTPSVSLPLSFSQMCLWSGMPTPWRCITIATKLSHSTRAVNMDCPGAITGSVQELRAVPWTVRELDKGRKIHHFLNFIGWGTEWGNTCSRQTVLPWLWFKLAETNFCMAPARRRPSTAGATSKSSHGGTQHREGKLIAGNWGSEKLTQQKALRLSLSFEKASGLVRSPRFMGGEKIINFNSFTISLFLCFLERTSGKQERGAVRQNWDSGEVTSYMSQRHYLIICSCCPNWWGFFCP